MEVAVGDRVQSRDDFRATVMYVGAVAGASPEDGWVGLEWDVAGRGKHNGFVKGVQYFTCPDGCGSFVRPDTVIQPSVSFQEAFIERYASEDAASALERMDFRAAGKKKAAVVVELVGKDREVTRMQKTADLETVTLPARRIARAGNAEWLFENAAGIGSLVLDDNLFKDWASVGELAAQLPNLHTLSLNGNRLQPPVGVSLSLPAALQALRKLSINSTGADFAQVNRLVKYLPALTDLHMASNGISRIIDAASPDPVAFAEWPALTLLDLGDNNIGSWAEVRQLAAFGKLEKLFLNGNSISEISFPPAAGDKGKGAGSDEFGALRVLALANNKVDNLSSISALRALVSLCEVRLQGNPVCEATGASAFRQLLIAMMPSVKSLNGGEVRERERTEAQKFYISYWLRQPDAPDAETISKSDCIFAALVQKHGLPAVAKGAAASGGPAMLNVNLTSMAADSSHKAPIARKLPAGMTVANVKRMCQQLFKLDVARQRLFAKARSETDMWNAELMEEDLKPISFYITHEECDIVMQEADEAVAQRDAKDKQEKQKQLEETQAKQQAALMAAQEEEVAAGKMAALAAVSTA
jgi:hypothetical protein